MSFFFKLCAVVFEQVPSTENKFEEGGPQAQRMTKGGERADPAALLDAHLAELQAKREAADAVKKVEAVIAGINKNRDEMAAEADKQLADKQLALAKKARVASKSAKTQAEKDRALRNVTHCMKTYNNTMAQIKRLDADQSNLEIMLSTQAVMHGIRQSSSAMKDATMAIKQTASTISLAQIEDTQRIAQDLVAAAQETSHIASMPLNDSLADGVGDNTLLDELDELMKADEEQDNTIQFAAVPQESPTQTRVTASPKALSLDKAMRRLDMAK
jgi:hypothetical protein